MNTSELTSRQSVLASQLQDQDFLHRLPLEQSNLLRREKETLDAYLQVRGMVQAANIPNGEPVAKEGIAIPPDDPLKVQPGETAQEVAAAPQGSPVARSAATGRSAPQNPGADTPDALGQDLDTAVKSKPIRKAAVQKKAPVAKVVSKHKK